MKNTLFINYFLDLKKDFLSRNYYLSLIGKNNKIRMYVYYFLVMIKFIFLRAYKAGN